MDDETRKRMMEEAPQRARETMKRHREAIRDGLQPYKIIHTKLRPTPPPPEPSHGERTEG